MDKLRTVYNLQYPDIMKVQITAYNMYGWGPVSDVNTLGATVYDVPLAMISPTRGPETKIASIHVLWTPLTAINDIRAPVVLSYNLQWDKGTNGVQWESLVGLSTETKQLSFTAVTGISGGQYYKFRVRAKNLYGWGDYSPEVSV